MKEVWRFRMATGSSVPEQTLARTLTRRLLPDCTHTPTPGSSCSTRTRSPRPPNPSASPHTLLPTHTSTTTTLPPSSSLSHLSSLSLDLFCRLLGFCSSNWGTSRLKRGISGSRSCQSWVSVGKTRPDLVQMRVESRSNPAILAECRSPDEAKARNSVGCSVNQPSSGAGSSS